MIKKITVFLEMIKFEHTVFALPLAYSGVLIAQKNCAPFRVWFWVSMCMALLRTAAMSLNRLIDRVIDQKNPRTQNRALCRGELSTSFVFFIALLCYAGFVASTAQLNSLCFHLSWVPLVLITLYPYLKRWTVLCHAVLGMTLACAPLGGWIAVTGYLEPSMLILFLAIFFWVMGFDIIYALQDVQFDRKEGLYSIPSRLGERKSLYLSQFFHLLMVALLIVLGFLLHLSWIYYAGVGVCALFLIREQVLAFSLQASKIEHAFFMMNAGVSLALLAALILDRWLM